MIYKHESYQNGYIFAPSSNDKDLQQILKNYDVLHCIICNRKTVTNFNLKESNVGITINNKLVDGVFFINKLL